MSDRKKGGIFVNKQLQRIDDYAFPEVTLCDGEGSSVARSLLVIDWY